MDPERRRADARAKLPPRLLLGITVPGVREHLAQLPPNAIQQVNASIPLDQQTGRTLYPTNDTINGYVNQFFIIRAASDGRSVCEKLREANSPHVGKANVFVSWPLSAPIATLADALEQFLAQHRLRADQTFFWICDYSIRQTPSDRRAADVQRLGLCVEAIGCTALLLQPWQSPEPLKRVYCIEEVYHTQASGAAFEVVMSTAQQAAFEQALENDFDSIAAAVSRVDVREVRMCRA